MSTDTPTPDKTFRIVTAWSDEGGSPWLLNAYCEMVEDEWGDTPDFFTEAIDKAKEAGSQVRVIELFTDYDAICERFTAGSVDAEIGEAPGG